MKMSRESSSPFRRALLVGVLYGAIGCLWVIGSDQLAAALFKNPELYSPVQTYMGWGFVLVSSLLLFYVVYQLLLEQRESESLNEEQANAIRELGQFQESVIDNATVWINVFAADGKALIWNKAAEHISGYARQDVIGHSRIWRQLFPDRTFHDQLIKKATDTLNMGEQVSEVEAPIVTRNGEKRLMSWSGRRLYDAHGKVAGIIVIALDVTDRRNAEADARARERQLKTLMGNIPGMAYRCLFDESWTMKFVSEGCREITGYEPDELIENSVVSFLDLIEPDDNDKNTRTVENAIAEAEPFAIEYAITRRDGKRIWVWEKGRGVDVDGELMLEGIIFDITERKALEQELSRMATHDALTGLLNRRELEARLESEVRRARRYRRPVALLWIDVDHFKSVNDRFGHAKGDDVLRRISDLLQSSVRAVDIAARYGGEEFVVVLPERDLEEASETAERLRSLVAEQDIEVAEGESINLSVSIGVAVYPLHGDNWQTLCSVADKAMYAAKSAGRNQVCLPQSAGDSW
ncbi:MAG: sensor domain-containing diguanylate cyclase [Alteromonadaceae bacterium]|nr:sensor domain-containing diguanylate cyclase [Alteromonadaceae bacterium]MBH85057.1 sensor domain-containing diguanylate cyclase [Alteromonadaceae bacterium]|tara:strand:- start:47758 stop:49326 length:1569 start_codon:yes stop_codon:yes gene_type:complete